jgi:hypothetical protein
MPADRSSGKDDEASDHRNGWVHASGRLQMQTDGYDMVLSAMAAVLFLKPVLTGSSREEGPSQ